MSVLVIGLVLFFAIHLIPKFLPGFRQKTIAKIGSGPWKGIYALISLAGFVLIVSGWGQYRADAPEIYNPPDWGPRATALFVLVAFILFSVPRKKPGRILVLVKHPMLFGIIYWSIGHLLANGDLASIMLFGSFLVYASTVRIAEAISGDPPHQFVSYRNDFLAVGVGVVLYGIFVLWIHGWLFGVAPF